MKVPCESGDGRAGRGVGAEADVEGEVAELDDDGDDWGGEEEVDRPGGEALEDEEEDELR